LSGSRKYLLKAGIKESKQHLYQNHPEYFSKLLPANQSWRLFPEFRDSTAYLDIETTGLDRQFNKITTIALYDGQAIKTYIQGQNLDDFIEDIQQYKVIVSYNGKSFDVPFLEQYFNIRLAQAHIDLRYVLSSLGFRGGLKGCERQMGMDRGDLKDIDGFFAVLLWDEYQRAGDSKALESLLSYNIQDTINLENLLVTAYNLKLKDTPFHDTHLIADSPPPVIPYNVDLETVDKIKRSPQYWQSQQWY
ncbi:ribonuclease H-like domain-containing protein, partial [Thermodesulfobacteriota bacterium]